MKTQATILQKLNEPLLYTEELETPTLKDGQVLVQIAYAGVCHSQLMEARGLRGEDNYLPHLLGHEGAGIVVETGKDVTKVKKGDRVVLSWIKGSGHECGGSKYNLNDETVNAGGVTCFQEHSVVSENRVTPIPADIPLDVAVLFGCALPTGAGIVLNSINPEDSKSILIWGLGGIGLSALLATQLYNLDKIVAVDIKDEKLELARELGATHTFNAKDENITELIKDVIPEGFDYAVEASGLVEGIETAFSLIHRNHGELVFASHPKHGDKISLDPFELICGKKIKGSWGGDSNPDRDIPKYCELYRQGKLPVEKLISKRFKLNEVNEALDHLEDKKINRAILEVNTSIV